MKKLLILSFILTSIHCFLQHVLLTETVLLVSLNSAVNQCSKLMHPNLILKEFSSTPEARLNPAKVKAPETELRNFRQVQDDYSYNSSCQFGVCNQTGAPQLFQHRTK